MLPLQSLKAVKTDGTTIAGNGNSIPLGWLGGHADDTHITGNGLIFHLF